jgi:putative transposase
MRLLCQVLGVSRPCYYHYRSQMAIKRDDGEHRGMVEWITVTAELRDQSYGSRRMRKVLIDRGYAVHRNKVKTLMREAGVGVRYRKKYKVTANSNRYFTICCSASLLCHCPITCMPLT